MKIKPTPKLETKHYVWLFDAAATHFAEAIKKCEEDIVRHTFFKEAPVPTAFLGETRTRQEEIERIQAFLDQYRNILEVCLRAKAGCADKSSQEFAESFAGFFRK